MNTKTLSNRALSVIDQYLHFSADGRIENSCSIPYFNNKTVRARGALRAQAGKGSPKDIYDEVRGILVKSHIAIGGDGGVGGAALKKILVDNNIGIDCSGFAYYILNAESQELGKGPLDKHLSFSGAAGCGGIVGRIRCALRPVENCSVAVLASDANSRPVKLEDVQVGDLITMIGGPDADDRDHVLVVHQIEYQNFAPIRISYSHSVAYPEDGVYGTGIRQGSIEISNWIDLFANPWIEGGKTGPDNRTFARAKKSKTEIRRLRSF